MDSSFYFKEEINKKKTCIKNKLKNLMLFFLLAFGKLFSAQELSVMGKHKNQKIINKFKCPLSLFLIKKYK